MAVKPLAFTANARSTVSSMLLAPPHQPLAYRRIFSRQGPPSRLYTGWPQTLPAMSHMAISMALQAA